MRSEAHFLLTPRLIAVYTMTAVLFVNALFGLDAWRRWAEADQDGRLETLLQARILSAYVQRTLEKYEFLGNDLLSRDFDGNNLGVDAELRRIRALDPHIMDLLLLTPDGRIRNWSGFGHPPRVDDREYCTALSNDPARDLHIGAPTLSRVRRNKWFFSVSLAQRNADRSIRQVAVVILDLATFNESLRKALYDDYLSVAIHLLDGTTVTRVPVVAGVYGRKVAQLAVFGGDVPQDFFAVQPSPIDGQMRYVAWRRLGGYPLVVVATLTKEHVAAPWRKANLAATGLALLISVLLGLAGRIVWQAARVNETRLEELGDLNERLRHMAITDPLTATYNRRHFQLVAAQELERARRYGHAFALITLDVDHFKDINDLYGHAAGDVCLRALAETTQRALRESDTMARLGGEEFAIVLPHTDLDGAVIMAERIRVAIGQREVAVDNRQKVTMTASLGVAEAGPEDEGIDPILRRADHALYQAKEAGRDRVCRAKV